VTKPGRATWLSNWVLLLLALGAPIGGAGAADANKEVRRSKSKVDTSAVLVLETFNSSTPGAPEPWVNAWVDSARAVVLKGGVTSGDSARLRIPNLAPGRHVVYFQGIGWDRQNPETLSLRPGEVHWLRHVMTGKRHEVQD
jgi:hypothetical protein